MLVAFVILAVQHETVLPSALTGLASSSPFAGLAVWVIHRQWKERDEERSLRLSERERDDADREKLLTAVIEATIALNRQTSLMERMEGYLR